ncbi:MAG: VanZ family protein [Ferruginibacter sp.]
MDKKIPFYNFLPGIAWFFIVLVLIAMPGKDIPGNSFLEKINFDKIVHACIFGLMVILFVRPIAMSRIAVDEKRKYYIQITVFTIIWGLTTEFIQKYLVTGRDFDLWDFAADAVGCSIACWFSLKYLLNRPA